jgi:GNAT superfamily N-acetyltransferase
MIRNGTEGDILKVSRLWVKMVTEMKPEWTPKVEWWRKIALNNLHGGRYFLSVADNGGKLSGFLDWFLYDEPSTGKLHAVGQHLFLDEEYRNIGIGNSLFHHAVEQAKKKKAEVIELMCFDNEKRFWEKKGFAPLRTLMRMEVENV